MPQHYVRERTHRPDGTTVDIPVPTLTQQYDFNQPSYDTQNLVNLSSFGATTRAPLGYVVIGRSGDKSSNAYLDLFIQNADEYEWLRTLPSVEKLRVLLGKGDKGKCIDGCEILNIYLVYPLL